jgi:hypothetical protein
MFWRYLTACHQSPSKSGCLEVLGRTGSLSLKAALEELGFAKCDHMVEVFARTNDARIWEAAARGEAVDWDKLFAGYRATVDVPSRLARSGARSARSSVSPSRKGSHSRP